ncbi:MAG: hypothetical protein RDV48_15880 [Candidatus Eremiobacteraeota bacterium]|nr:hypothetical protein [Candidatus Eremiobacteraeota bacterium]
MMQGIGTPGAGAPMSFDGDWQKLYRNLSEKGKVFEADGNRNFTASKKDGYVGISLGVDTGENMDVRLAPCSRKFIPANGMEGTRVSDEGEEKKVYFYKVDAPYIPEGAEATLRFEILKDGEKVEDRELTVKIKGGGEQG